MMMKRAMGFVALWMGLAVGLAARGETPEPMDAASGLQSREPDQRHVFKTTAQGDLKLHVYLPSDWKAGDQRPAMVFWFGGGFTKGSVAAFSRQSNYFATRGLVCVCAEYRIKSIHGTGIDKCIEDARSAMRWVKSHASQLGIAADRVIASGGSAGGTLALNLALGDGPNAPEDDLGISTRPCALVLFNPAQGPFIAGIAKQISAGDGEQARLIAQVSAIDRPQKDEPPAIFIFGTDDRLLEPSREFCTKALAMGDRCELWTAEGQRHAFFNRLPWYASCLRKADEFLVALGYLHGSPTVAAGAGAVLEQELPAPEARKP